MKANSFVHNNTRIKSTVEHLETDLKELIFAQDTSIRRHIEDLIVKEKRCV